MERNIHRLEQYSRRECIETVGVPNSITNDLLEEHVVLIFEKLGVVMGPMNIVAYHRLGETGRVIKLLNRKDAQNVLKKLVKDLNNEGLIDSFWITNGTIQIRESSQSKPISINHESDLHF